MKKEGENLEKMISNQNDITEYTNMNKIYIPSAQVNSNYSYRVNGDFIDIITNVNCYQNYNTTYCDCYRYNYKTNLMSNSYSCSTNSNNPTINFNYITSDINYSNSIREKFIQDKGLIIGIFIIGIIFAIFLTKERKRI